MFHTGGDCAACQPLLFPTFNSLGEIYAAGNLIEKEITTICARFLKAHYLK